MSSHIPIRNIYHLLLYALEMKPFSGKQQQSCEQAPDLINLLARLYALSIRSLHTRGLDRAYVAREEELAMVRGKIDFVQTTRRRSLHRARVACTFEELDANILPNRILRTSLDRLLQHSGLDAESRKSLRFAGDLLRNIDPVPLTGSVFQRLNYHRNNRHYRILMQLCRLITRKHMPHPEAGVRTLPGLEDLGSFLPGVFEKFVRNFAVIRFPEAIVGNLSISWEGEALDETSRAALPGMQTDLTMSWPDRRLILDCKFYRAPLTEHYGNLTLRSAHLYQLFAYLRNQARHSGWEQAEGIMLYPVVHEAFDYRYRLSGHPIRFTTLDLTRHWQEIEEQLAGLLFGKTLAQ